MDAIWHDVTLQDKPLIDSYYQIEQSRNCEFSFANNYLWKPFYPIEYGIICDCLVFRSCERASSVSFPLGNSSNEAKRRAILFLEEYFAGLGAPFRLHLVSPEQFSMLDTWFPGRYRIAYDRDCADYLYEGESLRELTGRKLHHKRTHINKFLSLYKDWRYESLTRGNEPECEDMLSRWWENNREEGGEKEEEAHVVGHALKLRDELALDGGLLRVNGRVVAFSMGEPLSKDTYVVHFEKAFADVEGAYTMINREFLRHAAASYRYINREDDAGSEGLRQAKLSYGPCMLFQKGTVTHRLSGTHRNPDQSI